MKKKSLVANNRAMECHLCLATLTNYFFHLFESLKALEKSWQSYWWSERREGNNCFMRTEHWVTSYHVPTCLPPRKSNKIVLGNFPSARSNCRKLIGPYEMLPHFPSSLCLIISRITEPTPLPLLPRDSVHPSRIKSDHACLLTLALGHLGTKLRQVYWIWISIAENALIPIGNSFWVIWGLFTPRGFRHPADFSEPQMKILVWNMVASRQVGEVRCDGFGDTHLFCSSPGNWG